MQPPVAIHTDGSVSCGAVLWRFRGRLQLTVVVKSVFTLVPDGVAAHAGPGEIVAEDRQHGGHPSRSVQTASDLAPWLKRCDVLFTGHAYAPGGSAPAGSVRLGLSRDGHPVLDKTLHVFGDRGAGGGPGPFAKIPIVYERAVGGPGEPNPVGTASPNLVDPTDARRPAGFGPLSRFWQARKRLLGNIDRATLDGPVAEIPEAMPWEYFQAAPPDQQIDRLLGGEWLVLDGLHPTRARVQTRIPALRAAARIMVRAAGAGGPPALATGGDAPQAIELMCDTVAIDGEGQALSLSWRGRYEVSGGEEALPSLLVVAALETPGVAVDWATLLAAAPPAAPRAAEGAAKTEGAGEGTISLRPEQADVIAKKASLPFERSGAPASPPSADATPWGKKPIRPAPVAAAGEETVGLAPGSGKKEVSKRTVAMAIDQQAAAAQRPAAPFALHTPETAAHPAAPIPGAPWSEVKPAPVSAPPGTEGEETLVPYAMSALRPPVVAPPPVPPLVAMAAAPPVVAASPPAEPPAPAMRAEAAPPPEPAAPAAQPAPRPTPTKAPRPEQQARKPPAPRPRRPEAPPPPPAPAPEAKPPPAAPVGPPAPSAALRGSLYRKFDDE